MTDLLPYFVNLTEDLKAERDPVEAMKVWQEAAFLTTSCHEAIQIFPDPLKCPYCLASVDNDMVLVHRKVVKS